MYIPNNATLNYPFCRLQCVVETFGHSTYHRYCKTLGTSVINGPMSPPYLEREASKMFENIWHVKAFLQTTQQDI